MIDGLDEFWKKYLGGCEAFPHKLKHTFQERWVRFHALPDSKRYPENEIEYQEVFSRVPSKLGTH